MNDDLNEVKLSFQSETAIRKRRLYGHDLVRAVFEELEDLTPVKR